MATLVVTTNNANLVYGGSTAGTGSTAGKAFRRLAADASSVKVAFLGTRVDLSYCGFSVTNFEYLVDGVLTQPATLNDSAWHTFTLATGLTDTWHELEVRKRSTDVIIEVANFLTVTGAAPAVRVAAGFSTNVYQVQTQSGIGHDMSLSTSSVEGPILTGNGYLRWKSTSTGFQVFCFLNGVNLRLVVDDDLANSRLLVLTTTNHYGWFEITGCDGNAEHQYHLMYSSGLPANGMFVAQLVTVGGTLNTAALAARGYYLFLGDSITAGVVLADLINLFVNKYAFSKLLGYRNMGLSGRQVHSNGSTGGIDVAASIAALNPAPLAIFILLGVNDAGTVGRTSAQFQTDYSAMLSPLFSMSTSIPIFCSGYTDVASGQLAANNRIAFNAANSAAVAAAAKINIHNANTDGIIDPTLHTVDGIHLNTAGNQIYTDFLLRLTAASVPFVNYSPMLANPNNPIDESTVVVFDDNQLGGL